MKKLYFLISFVLLGLCYLPALCLPFAHHDNARFFDKYYTPPWINPDKRDPQYSMAYLIGRPFTAEIHQVIYTHVHYLNDLKKVRWLTVAVFAICAGFLANILLAFGLSSLESLVLSVAVFILPGVQDAVIMLAVQNGLAVLAVLWAYLIFCRPRKSVLEDLLDCLVIFCLITTSMLFYPQWSFFFFVPILIKYLTAPPKNLASIHQEGLRALFLFSMAAIFYYFYIKTFVSSHNAKAGSYAFTIDLNFLYWKVLKVFTHILPMAFNFWNIHTIHWIGVLFMVLTAVLLRQRTILSFLLIISTTSFWLLARTDLVLHRIFFVTSVMALTAFLIGIRNVFRGNGMIAKYTIVLAMTAGLMGVHFLTFYNAVNDNIEFAFIKQSLLSYKKPYSRIHIILPAPNGKGYNGLATVDDTFNAKTASFNFTTDTLNLLRAALNDIHVPTNRWVYSCEEDQQKCMGHMPSCYYYLVTHSYKGQAVYYSPGMVLIDLNNL